jgi:hypothetical protein
MVKQNLRVFFLLGKRLLEFYSVLVLGVVPTGRGRISDSDFSLSFGGFCASICFSEWMTLVALFSAQRGKEMSCDVK